jgi:hypothetical protein
LARGRPTESPFALGNFPGKSLSDQIEGLDPQDPLRSGLLVWCDVLLERRINFEAMRAESRAKWEVELPPLPPLTEPTTLCRWEDRLLRALVWDRQREAEELLRGLNQRVDGLSAVRRERFARRLEIEHRLGSELSEMLEVSAEDDRSSGGGAPPPGVDLEQESSAPEALASASAREILSQRLGPLALQVLSETQAAFSAWVGPGYLQHLKAIWGVSVSQGWPARLTADTLTELLGGNWLTWGLNLRGAPLPERLAPASFVLAVQQLSRAVAVAAAPRDLPFVVAQHPAGLPGEILGHTLTGWMASPDFVRRRLKLSGDAARQAERALWLLRAGRLRQKAVNCLVLLAAKRSLAELDRVYEETTERLGQSLGPSLGMLPVSQLSEVEFCAALCGSARAANLREVHDEDFVDNPRARDQLRSELEVPAPRSSPRLSSRRAFPRSCPMCREIERSWGSRHWV